MCRTLLLTNCDICKHRTYVNISNDPVYSFVAQRLALWALNEEVRLSVGPIWEINISVFLDDRYVFRTPQ